MLKLFLRHAAPLARASLLGQTAASVWLAALPAAQAAYVVASPRFLTNLSAQYPPGRLHHFQAGPTPHDRVGEIGGWRTYLRESQQTGEAPDQTGQAHHAH